MDALFSPLELASAAGGRWTGGCVPARPLSISSDTRTDNRGRIFFALRGERFDAHDFLDMAAASGCSALCVAADSAAPRPSGIPVLEVEDTLRALQACAAFHRRRFPDLTLLGVTGSVGKTSVKEMLRAICSGHFGGPAVLCTEGNTNNQIGVAQNLLKLTGEHRCAVLEAGTNSFGEIAPLAKMMMPSAAMVNSIAPCHLEKLVDLDGVAREKSDIFLALAPDGAAVFPADVAGEDILRRGAGGHRIYTFGMDGRGDVSAHFLGGDLDGSRFELSFPGGAVFQVGWKLTGPHNALNAAGAAALAFSCGISPEVIAGSLPDTELPGMRMKKSVVSGVTYYNDAYNANPASMHASAALLASSTFSGRLFLVLGGMRELGGVSRSAHIKLLDEMKRLIPEAQVITVGAEFAGLWENHFDSSEAAGEYLAAAVREGDTVFAKGSRGNCVEKALPPEAR